MTGKHLFKVGNYSNKITMAIINKSIGKVYTRMMQTFLNS